VSTSNAPAAMFWFRRLALFSVLLCLCVVVFGAYVRLSDAGLGCPDWPGCYGHLTIPQAEHEVALAEQRYPERPVEAPKAWKEMIHRYLASGLGLLIVLMALLSLRLRQPDAPRALPWALVALVIFQGVLGMWTVTWQLKPLVVTAHLLGGMTTLSLLFWLWLSARRLHAAASEAPAREPRSERHARFELGAATTGPAPAGSAPRGLRAFALIGLILLAAQIFLGGWTSTNYAALACPDLPTCHGSYWPEMDLDEAFTLWRGLGINYEYGVLDNRARVTIHFIHRLGAIAVTIVLGLLALWLLRSPGWRGYGAAVLLALTAQIVIGLSIVKLQLPLLLATAHNAGAALLLLSLVLLHHRLWQRP
jgi:heme a synthase